MTKLVPVDYNPFAGESPGLLAKLAQTWPARMAKDAWQAVKLPGDVYQGNVPITGEDGRTNPEVINRAADLAGILMGGTYATAPLGAVGVGAVRRREPGSLADLARYIGDGSFVRWSRGPKYDMRPSANSRDYQSGQVHEGLSAIPLSGDMSPLDIVRAINDYSFLRMKDEGIRPHIYTAKRVATDSDGAPTIRPIKPVGVISDEALSFMDFPNNIERLSIKEQIENTRRALEYFAANPPKDNLFPIHTPERLVMLEKKFAGIGGEAALPFPFFFRY